MIGIGIIGAGAFGKYVVSAYNDFLVNGRVTAIASRTRSRAEALATEMGIPLVLDDNDSLLSHPDVDVVAILTPPMTHVDLATHGLRNGKHLLIDKPVAFTTAEIDALTDLAADNHLEMSTNLVLRVHPFHRRIREIRESGKMGELLQVITSAALARYPEGHWYWQPDVSGGFFLNTFSHFFDLYEFIIGSSPTARSAIGNPTNGYSMTAAFDGGAIASLTATLQVSNDNERIHTTYVFERGVVETHDWLPSRMEIRPDEGDGETRMRDDKDEDYRRCLATIMDDLCRRASGDTSDADVGIDLSVIRDSVRIPLTFESLLLPV